MDERFTMCNMAIEAGGKSGIVGFDEKTTRYLQGRPEGSRARTVGQVFASDRDAEYARVIEVDVAAVPPTASITFCFAPASRSTRRWRRF